MQPDRGFTWGGLVPRRLGPVAAAVVLLAANVGGTLAAPGAAYDPALDGYSMANTDAIIGAPAWWDAGYRRRRGRGAHRLGRRAGPGTERPGKIIYGPDLSLESQSPALRNLDTYGHGTFMAGLIAGRDDAASAPYSRIRRPSIEAWHRTLGSSVSRSPRPTAERT